MTGIAQRRRIDRSRDRGYSDDDINVMMSDDTRNKWYGDGTHDDSELGTKAAEGATAGGAIGGTLGAVIGGIAALGTNLVLPGLGLVVWGPIERPSPEQVQAAQRAALSVLS